MKLSEQQQQKIYDIEKDKAIELYDLKSEEDGIFLYAYYAPNKDNETGLYFRPVKKYKL